MIIGQIYKIHSDFYYVKSQDEFFECKLRENLKKQKLDFFVGDFVNIENGFIISLINRKNYIKRPSIANLDVLLVVSALKEPELDFIQLNRYLIFAKFHKIETVLCFNKEDLVALEDIVDIIEKIYKPLGYKIFFTSVKENKGISELKKYLENKTVVLCGNSGVGKTSLVNSIFPDYNLRTKSVSNKTKRGVHTTRHSEIIEHGKLKIVDTPGFSQIKFDFLLPNDLANLFDEINNLKTKCKFKDCTHTTEIGCSVLANIKQIAKTRYESYLAFLEEAKEFKSKIQNQGFKKEFLHKENMDKIMPKISLKKRELSRKTTKQNINKDTIN